MKIVSRKEFLKLPAYTVFQKYTPCVFDDIEIKVCDPGIWGSDFLTLPLSGYAEGITDSGDNFEIIDSGKDFKWDLEMVGRDGFFDEGQLFAVWDKEDVKRLISQLNKCL